MDIVFDSIVSQDDRRGFFEQLAELFFTVTDESKEMRTILKVRACGDFVAVVGIRWIVSSHAGRVRRCPPLRLRCQTVDHSGRHALSLIRARYLILNEGQYACLAISILPLPSSPFLTDASTGPPPLSEHAPTPLSLLHQIPAARPLPRERLYGESHRHHISQLHAQIHLTASPAVIFDCLSGVHTRLSPARVPLAVPAHNIHDSVFQDCPLPGYTASPPSSMALPVSSSMVAYAPADFSCPVGEDWVADQQVRIATHALPLHQPGDNTGSPDIRILSNP